MSERFKNTALMIPKHGDENHPFGEPVAIPYDKSFRLFDMPDDQLTPDGFTALPSYRLKADLFDVGIATPHISKSAYDAITVYFDLELSPEYKKNMNGIVPKLSAHVIFKDHEERTYLSDPVTTSDICSYKAWTLPRIPLSQYGSSNIRELYKGGQPIENPLTLPKPILRDTQFQFGIISDVSRKRRRG